MTKLSSTSRTLLTLVASIATLSLAPVSVYAAHGNSEGNLSGSMTTTKPADDSTTSGKQNRTTEAETQVEAEHATETETHDANDDSVTTKAKTADDSLKSRAAKLLDDKRQDGKQRSTAERQQACQKRQSKIDDRSGGLGSRAQRHLDRFDALFTKVRAYQTAKQLDVSNYDALVADATAKQSAATSVVATLTGLAGTKIDCTSSDPASTVANVKVAAGDAKTALQAYRASLKALVEALLSAKTAANATGGTN